MRKYLFLQVYGTIFFTDETTGEAFMKNGPIEYLGRIIKETGCSVIFLDSMDREKFRELCEVLEKLNFPYLDKIMGSILGEDFISVIGTQDAITTKQPVPLFVGNRLEHYIANFLERGYYYGLTEEPVKSFEIWENGKDDQPVYKGMRILELGKDFRYMILGNVAGLIDHQVKYLVATNPKEGITEHHARIIMTSYKN